MVDVVGVAFKGHHLVVALKLIKTDGALLAHAFHTAANFLCLELILLSHPVVGGVKGKDRLLHAERVHSKFN